MHSHISFRFSPLLYDRIFVIVTPKYFILFTETEREEEKEKGREREGGEEESEGKQRREMCKCIEYII